jgi:hypothetical protein
MDARIFEIALMCDDTEAGMVAVPELLPYMTNEPNPSFSTCLSQVSLFDEGDEGIGVCYSYGSPHTDGIVIGYYDPQTKVLTLGCHAFFSESISINYTPATIEEFFLRLAEAAHAGLIQRRLNNQRYRPGLGHG